MLFDFFDPFDPPRVSVPGGPLQRYVEDHIRRLDRARNWLRLLSLGEDHAEDTMLVFKVRYNGATTVYTYGALRTNDRWYLTGQDNLSFDTLSELAKNLTEKGAQLDSFRIAR